MQEMQFLFCVIVFLSLNGVVGHSHFNDRTSIYIEEVVKTMRRTIFNAVENLVPSIIKV
jgi:hypothetical protein